MECLKECPSSTEFDNVNYICKDKNRGNDYILTETGHLFFGENYNQLSISDFMNYYSNNFLYTNKHISSFKSNNVTITLYKDNGDNSLSDTSLDIPIINYDSCFNKIKSTYGINDSLIIAVQSKNIEDQNNQIINFTVYDPRNGKEILYNELCENIPVIVEENINNKIEDIESFLFLSNQGIELGEKNNDFYTDLCFHYKSPFDGKDIPLKDRIKLFFPNIPLCDEGCFLKGINKATNRSICECKLNDWINNDIIEGNKFLKNSMAEIKTLLQKTNIEVLRCYKDLFHIKYYTNNHGSFIILSLLLIQIILTIIYYKKYIFSMRSYLYNITQNYLLYLSSKGIDISDNFENSLKQNNNLIKAPPKKNMKNDLIDANSRNGERNAKKAKTSNLMKKVNKPKRHSEFFRNKPLSNKKLLELSGKKEIQNKGPYNYKESDPNNKDKLCSSRNEIKIENTLIQSNKLNIDMEEYIKTDPNNMDYDNAIKRDKRQFCTYFGDKLKSELLILNIFCNYEPLNPTPIKCLLFILNIDLYFFVNGLFFTEEYLSEMFNVKNNSVFELIDRFADRIFYITLIGIIINYIADFFFYEENTIKKIFKREKNNILFLKYEMSLITKNIKSRYNSFIIICFIVALLIWYYVFCFNNIYSSMKEEWIITSIIIIFVMQIVYFLKMFLEACIRFISLKCKSEKLYKFSLFLS